MKHIGFLRHLFRSVSMKEKNTLDADQDFITQKRNIPKGSKTSFEGREEEPETFTFCIHDNREAMTTLKYLQIMNISLTNIHHEEEKKKEVEEGAPPIIDSVLPSQDNRL